MISSAGSVAAPGIEQGHDGPGLQRLHPAGMPVCPGQSSPVFGSIPVLFLVASRSMMAQHSEAEGEWKEMEVREEEEDEGDEEEEEEEEGKEEGDKKEGEPKAKAEAEKSESQVSGWRCMPFCVQESQG